MLCKMPWPGRGKTRPDNIGPTIVRAAKSAVNAGWDLCLLGVSGRDNDVGRNVMIGVGFEHDRALIGACEVAGLLDRVLTGVTVSDI